MVHQVSYLIDSAKMCAKSHSMTVGVLILRKMVIGSDVVNMELSQCREYALELLCDCKRDKFTEIHPHTFSWWCLTEDKTSNYFP